MKFLKNVSSFTSRVVRKLTCTTKTVALKASERQKPHSFSIPSNGVEPPSSVGVHQFRNSLNAAASRQRLSRRMVLIDGTDVALAHGGANGTFSVSGLEICLDRLSQTNETYAVVPQFRLKRIYCSNNGRLQQLQKLQRVLITPGKTIHNEIFTCNPRLFLLDIAKEFGAAIVSNDAFVEERRVDRDFQEILESRQIGFAWRNNDIEFHLANNSSAKSVDDILNPRY